MSLKNERGAALLMAVIGLIVGGSLVTAYAMVSVLDHRESMNTRRVGQAFGVAEAGLSETVGGWAASGYSGLDVGDSVIVSGQTTGGTGSYDVIIKRLNDKMFIVDVIGSDAASGARQRVGAFVKLNLLEMDIQAAMTIRGHTNIQGNSQIDGTDDAPGGWADCPSEEDLAGVRIPDMGDLDFNGNNCRNGACVDGDPPLMEDPSVTDSTFFDYGDSDWDDVVAMANKIVTPGTMSSILPSFTSGGASCNTGDTYNWGDPLDQTSACAGYFPIIYSPGDLHITGRYGQGILLVDGDLSVTGGFQFYGVVIVRGKLRTAGQGGHFNGAVLAANASFEENTVSGAAVVSYSSCALSKALSSAGSGSMIRSRGWLYSF